MKRFATILLLGVTLCAITTSCFKRTSPEDQVRDFARRFVGHVNAGRLDSLRDVYPGVIDAMSLVRVESDSIIVSPTAEEGKYLVTLADGISIKTTVNDDGTVTVDESTGLFNFPAEDLELAKQTGLWEADLNDAALSKRMHDRRFFDYLKGKTINTYDMLTLNKKGQAAPHREFSKKYTVYNNTDKEIKGSDYKVKFGMVLSMISYETGHKVYSRYFSERGKDIAPYGTAEFIIEDGDAEEYVDPIGIEITIPADELQRRFATYTGNEYKEYLSATKH